MYTFTSEDDWRNNVAYIDLLSKLTKKDITAFANRYLGNNYVAVYKRMGEDKGIVKVEKPAITPVETNAGAQSAFVKEVEQMPLQPLKPVWLDFNKDLQRSKIGPAEILYVQNNDNGLFRMAYRINTGIWNDKRLSVAANYLQFLGTPKMTSEEISQEFYKLACSFNVNATNEFTTISLEGIQENFSQATALLEDLLANCQPDEQALTSLKARIAKSRADAKNNKNVIMQGLMAYARFGPSNPFNNVLSDAELQALTAKELTDLIQKLPSYEHRVLYYGPLPLNQLTATLGKLHKVPVSFATPPPAKQFRHSEQAANQVLFTDYDMVQSEIRWVRNIPGYDPSMQPQIEMFNNYFGGSMGSVVFQTIRESKALAYSTSALFVTPEKKEDPYYVSAYVGSQADKLNEAVAAMNELLTDLPSIENSIANARSSIRKNIETERITQDAIIYNYLAAERRGLKDDYRKAVYSEAEKLGYNELKAFHQRYMAGKPYTYVVVASEKKVPEKDLQKLGTVKKLSKEEIFGY
jgi:predicted Zn-dependent peptidase